jgi:hypothetical protein
MLYVLFAIQFLSTNGLPLSAGKPTELTELENGNDTSILSFKEEQGIHQAVTLSSLAILLILHRGLMQDGFKLRRNGIHFCHHIWYRVLLGTDVMVGLGIGALSILWTAVIVISGYHSGIKPCTISRTACLGRLSYIPWLLLGLFVFWILAYLSEAIALGAIPAHHNVRFYVRKFGIWQVDTKCTCSYSNWSGSIRPLWRGIFFASIAAPITVTAAGAFQSDLWSTAFLTLAGWFLFVLGVGGENTYNEAPHRYAGDYLRVVLPSRHEYGLAYVLPSEHEPFHAIFNPRIEYEHRFADGVERHLRETPSEARRNFVPDIRNAMASFSAACCLHEHQLIEFTEWLYQVRFVEEGAVQKADPHHKPYSVLASYRAAGTQLIGKDLMYALCHAEYIVFQRREELEALQEEKYQKEGKRRIWIDKHSKCECECKHGCELECNCENYCEGSCKPSVKNIDGLVFILRWRRERAKIEYDEWVHPRPKISMSKRRGLKGLEYAVKYVYRLFGETLDYCWDDLSKSSVAATDISQSKASNRIDTCKETYVKPFASHFPSGKELRHTYWHHGKHPKKAGKTIEDYMGETWDECVNTQETMFAALYAFTCHWRDDIGNKHRDEWISERRKTKDEEEAEDSNVGSVRADDQPKKPNVHWCNSPIIAGGIPRKIAKRNRKVYVPASYTKEESSQVGDLVSFLIVWRQAWYTAIIAQLLAMAPIIFSAFIAGILS